MSLVICNKVSCKYNQGNACNKQRIVIDVDGICISRSIDVAHTNNDNEFIEDYDFKRCMI